MKVAFAVCTGEPESVTLKPRVTLVGTAGVPLIRPLDALSDRPEGNVPAVNCQVYAPVPPVAARVCEYAESAWPLGRDVVVIVNSAGLMVRLKVWLAVWTGEPESATLNVSGAITGVVGVPLITPVAPFRLKPAGNVPAVNCHIYAPVPPVAANVTE